MKLISKSDVNYLLIIKKKKKTFYPGERSGRCRNLKLELQKKIYISYIVKRLGNRFSVYIFVNVYKRIQRVLV